jgi:hypothetical protein
MTSSVNPRGGPDTPGLVGRSARCTRALACILALMVAPDVQAQEEEEEEDTDFPASTKAPSNPDAPNIPPWKTRFGVKVDAGAPDGVGAAALVHPMRWIRAHAGATRNTLGFGVRGGVSLIPLELLVAPTLDVDIGHYFNADYGKLLTRLHGQPTPAATRIRGVGYTQASASIGLEFSPSRSVTLFGNVGISYWSMRVNDVDAFIRDAVDDPGITAKPLSLSLTSPAVKLGLIVYFN